MLIDKDHPAVTTTVSKMKMEITIFLKPLTSSRIESLVTHWVRRILMNALPLLTADDIRNTPAGKELINS